MTATEKTATSLAVSGEDFFCNLVVATFYTYVQELEVHAEVQRLKESNFKELLALPDPFLLLCTACIWIRWEVPGSLAFNSLAFVT